MGKEVTNKELWNALNANERKEACVAFFEADKSRVLKEMKDDLIADLAEVMNFRVKFLKLRYEPEKLADFLYPRLNSRSLRAYLESILREWLLINHNEMIECFLDSQGIPHEDCFITEEAKTPSVESFATGVQALKKQYDQRIAAVYLGFVLENMRDAFWENLVPALESESFDIRSKLIADGQEPIETFEQEHAALGETQSPEEGESDTTLDKVLFKTVVASALGAEGALSPDEAEHLIDEIIDLSVDRQHSYIHLGFLHSLFDWDPRFEFPGANSKRKTWYACGYLLGLIRNDRHSECIKLLSKSQAIGDLLATTQNTPCGARLLPHLYGAMLDGGHFGMLQKWLKNQLGRMAPEHRERLLVKIQDDGSVLLRQGKTSEADILLEIVNNAMIAPDLDPGFKKFIKPLNMRKRAQTLQAQGNFNAAGNLLDTLIENGNFDDAPNAMADRGLVRGGFRSLHAVLPANDEKTVPAHKEALAKGVPDFKDSVQRYGEKATNANFCLGMLEMLDGEETSEAGVDHFQYALTGMLRKEDAYTEGGLICWAQFGLGLALLETMDVANLRNAMDKMNKAIESKLPFPPWLWEKALRAALVYDDLDVARMIAGNLYNILGSEAFPVLQQADSQGLRTVRKDFFDWLQGEKLQALDRWDALSGFFKQSKGHADGGLEEDILDAMEVLATDEPEVRAKFIELLTDSQEYEPTWSNSDAEKCLARLHELDGQFQQAANILSRRFYKLRSKGTAYSIFEARQTANRIHSYRIEGDPYENMLESLKDFEADEAVEDGAVDRLRAGHSVSVLYVGGNETQAAYCERIKTTLREKFPGLRVEFYLPGWDSSWSKHFDKVKPMISQSHVVVLNSLVRTQFGRHVREFCGSEHPWRSCTGHGRKSLQMSIEKAALWAMERMGDNNP